MCNVAFLNNTAGFGGGAMHLSNTMPIQAGEAFDNITVVGNTVSAFAAGANIYGGASETCCRRHLYEANRCCGHILCATCQTMPAPSD